MPGSSSSTSTLQFRPDELLANLFRFARASCALATVACGCRCGWSNASSPTHGWAISPESRLRDRLRVVAKRQAYRTTSVLLLLKTLEHLSARNDVHGCRGAGTVDGEQIADGGGGEPGDEGSRMVSGRAGQQGLGAALPANSAKVGVRHGTLEQRETGDVGVGEPGRQRGDGAAGGGRGGVVGETGNAGAGVGWQAERAAHGRWE